MTPRAKWSQEDLLVALNVYHKMTFGQMHARQPLIIEVAGKMGRSANSLAMKLCNFASLDPALKLRGIKGLSGASILDVETWRKFHADILEMAPASEVSFRRLYGFEEEDDVQVIPKVGVIVRKRPPLKTEGFANVKVRYAQEFFREAVVNNFDGRCGVSILSVRELLIASHILPWSTHPAERLNVRNGLCLSRIHDAAFDQGFIAFDDSLRLMMSSQLKKLLPSPEIVDFFGKYEGQILRLPEDAVLPDAAFLEIHRNCIFKN